MLVAVVRLLIVGFFIVVVAGCAHYARLPLDPQARYAGSIDALQAPPASGAPLREDDVTRLILQNSPSLKLAALRHNEAQSQATADALPPNPGFSGGLGYLLSGAGDATAWTAALSESVNGWITLRARSAEARASVAEVDASLAWEAWQAIAKGRQLVADVGINAQLFDAQTRLSDALQRQRVAVAAAQQRGDIDIAISGPIAQAADEAALAAAETARTLAAQRRELHALLGLSFDAPLALAPLAPLVPFDEKTARLALDDLPRHRPDLVALAMGYDAEDARFRAAVLAQFPALSVGYAASQDNSRVRNGGPEVTIDLPVFDSGRTRAKASEATRQRLHDEYGQRIADATDEVEALLVANRVASGDLEEMARTASLTPDRMHEASDALARGDLDRNAFTDVTVAALSRRVAMLRTEMAARDQRIGLETLLGIGMPPLDIDKANY